MPTPVYDPINFLEYGVAAIAVIALGVVVYLFVKFLTNHMSKITYVLDDLVHLTRSHTEEVFRATRATRDLEDKIEELKDELCQERRGDG